MSSIALPRLRDPAGWLPTAGAFAYALGGYALGWALCVGGGLGARVAGTLLLAHTMVIAAYLVHDLAHDSVFREQRWNARLGELMSFLCGASYASFARIRHMHIRHHRDKGDFTTFDPKAFLLARPHWVRRAVLALEWAYVPAVELLMHGQVIVRPFLLERLRPARARVIANLVVRGAVAVALLVYAPAALLCYVLAYWMLLTFLNLNDAFHHTFEQQVVVWDERVPQQSFNRHYELENTYSNLVSQRYPALNLIQLNFGYHRAHHKRMSVPWYRLPALHRELYGDDPEETLPYRDIVRSFYVNRLRRVFDDDYGTLGRGPGRADGFIGAHGVSFLSIV